MKTRGIFEMYNFENICEVVVKKLKVSPEVMISSKTRLVEDLGFDSLRMMQLLTDLEDKFDVFIPDIDLSQIKSLGDIELIITQQRQICA